MKEGRPKVENKGLIILLCVLLVVAVGLGVGIGVVKINKKASSGVSEEGQDYGIEGIGYPEVQYATEVEPDAVPATRGPIGEEEE